MKQIGRFDKENRFLSNFWEIPGGISWQGHLCKTVEHGYQLSKTLDVEWQRQVNECETPGRSKRLGQKVPLRSDWENVKVSIMWQLLRLKFSEPGLRKRLLETGDMLLVEGNRWHDMFWGKCQCERCGGVGRNVLGLLLMRVRSELK